MLLTIGHADISKWSYWSHSLSKSSFTSKLYACKDSLEHSPLADNRYQHLMDRLISFTNKAPITTAADDKFCYIFPIFPITECMIFHENRLPADDSQKISCLIGYFLKKQINLKVSSAANYRWRFMG